MQHKDDVYLLEHQTRAAKILKHLPYKCQQLA